MGATDLVAVVVFVLGLLLSLGWLRALLGAIARRGRPAPTASLVVWGVVLTLIFGSIGIYSMVTGFSNPEEVVVYGMARGMRGWSAGLIGVTSTSLALSFGLVPLVLTLTAGRHHEASPKEPNPTTTRPALEGMRSDEVWERGPEAVAACMYAIWVDIGEPNDWDSDERLWDIVHSELGRRYPQEWRRDEFHEKLVARYHELLQDN